ncbi:MAG: hypothetical protein DRO39_01915 [Thermoprotei archaeon]|nr:MAG: hypothetical protein DRO39_01915 [Thermoprotei archaeon]
MARRYKSFSEFKGAVLARLPSLKPHFDAIESNVGVSEVVLHHLYVILRSLHAVGLYDLLPTEEDVVDFMDRYVGG